MPVVYSHVSLDERRRIFQLLDQRRPIADIAETLGRHRSTIYRDNARNKIDADRANRRFPRTRNGANPVMNYVGQPS